MYNVLYLKPNVNSFELLQGVTGCCGRNLTEWMDVVTDNALFGELLRQDSIRVYNYSSQDIEEYMTKLGVNATTVCYF